MIQNMLHIPMRNTKMHEILTIFVENDLLVLTYLDINDILFE